MAATALGHDRTEWNQEHVRRVYMAGGFIAARRETRPRESDTFVSFQPASRIRLFANLFAPRFCVATTSACLRFSFTRSEIHCLKRRQNYLTPTGAEWRNVAPTSNSDSTSELMTMPGFSTISRLERLLSRVSEWVVDFWTAECWQCILVLRSLLTFIMFECNLEFASSAF